MNTGFKEQKTVNNIFSSVSNKYDLMNDVMSLGLHRAWKTQLMGHITRFDGKLLDLASGTADVALKYLKTSSKHNHSSAQVVLCDINQDMLKFGREKLLNSGFVSNYDIVTADAMKLPFYKNTFDFCTIAFGMRNFPSIKTCLEQVYYSLKPGGKFICMEFSPTQNHILSGAYDFYSLKIIPGIGKMVANNEDAYKYLVESIRAFPTPEQFEQSIVEAGFRRVSYEILSFGILAIHYGYKLC